MILLSLLKSSTAGSLLQPAAEEVAPHPVDEGPGKIVVLDHPLGQHLPPGLAGEGFGHVARHQPLGADLAPIELKEVADHGREGRLPLPVAALVKHHAVGVPGRIVWSSSICGGVDARIAGCAGLVVPLRSVWRKKPFTPQKSDCTYSLWNGWSWHCTHCDWMPRKSLVTREVIGTASYFPSLT